MKNIKKKLSGWGKYPIIQSKIYYPKNEKELLEAINFGKSIARGNGRSYGDSAINNQNTISMKHFNRIIKFDERSGQLIAEAGVLLSDVINSYLHIGWFPWVTPGTKFVTLGGLIAADAHGKNHHKHGSFSEFVDWLEIIGSNGKLQHCSRQKNSELFYWTIGGMGLTGVILRVAIRLRPVESSWLIQQTLKAKNIDSAIDLFEQSIDSTYSVAWIDCLKSGKSLGRSLILLGEHASLGDLPKKYLCKSQVSVKKGKLSIPFEMPHWIMMNWVIKLFNAIYFFYGSLRKKKKIVSWDEFFYPLDRISKWNNLYGKNGFVQFQCVIPLDQSRLALRELLLEISKAKTGSFLAVLKRFGAQDSHFSFPMEGYTLALDFPANERSFSVLERMDDITISYGGRFYMAKDSRISSSKFFQSDIRVKKYINWRKKNNLAYTFQSAQSQRLNL